MILIPISAEITLRLKGDEPAVFVDGERVDNPLDQSNLIDVPIVAKMGSEEMMLAPLHSGLLPLGEEMPDTRLILY